MAAGDTYRVTISATGQGSIYQNVLGVQYIGAGDPTTANFQTFVDDWLTVWRATQMNTLVYTQWEAVQLWGEGMSINAPECTRSGGKAFGDQLTASGTVVTGDSLPPQSAVVTTWLTGFSGRRRRGRSYAFGQVEANQADGLWASAFLTSLRTRLDTFINVYKGTSGTSPIFTLGVWSERTASGCVPATPPAKGHVQVDVPLPDQAFTQITGYVVRPTVFSQRRRTRGVGR